MLKARLENPFLPALGRLLRAARLPRGAMKLPLAAKASSAPQGLLLVAASAAALFWYFWRLRPFIRRSRCPPLGLQALHAPSLRLSLLPTLPLFL